MALGKTGYFPETEAPVALGFFDFEVGQTVVVRVLVTLPVLTNVEEPEVTVLEKGCYWY